MLGEEAPDHGLVQLTDSYLVRRHPAGKMGDGGTVR